MCDDVLDVPMSVEGKTHVRYVEGPRRERIIGRTHAFLILID